MCLRRTPTVTSTEPIFLRTETGTRATRPLKAQDLIGSLITLAGLVDARELAVAEIGAGSGALLAALAEVYEERCERRRMHVVGFEIGPDAVALGRRNFPNLELNERTLQASDGPFDVILCADVLEHLENPWEMLRLARDRARFLLVRQPLLGGLSLFRHRDHRMQREHWGHIGSWDVRSFTDMATATGWSALDATLTPKWRMPSFAHERPRLLKKLGFALAPDFVSFLSSGFYMLGAYE